MRIRRAVRTVEAESRRRGGLLLPLLLAGGATAGLTTLTSGAFFTDSQAVANNTITTGTVKLGASPASAAVTVANMAPGDVKVGTVTISNAGSMALRYAMLSTADNTDGKGLAAQLQMTVKVGVSSCTAAGFGADGTVVYGAGVFGSTTGTKVFGDATAGQQAGDRTLSAGTNEALCVYVTLPSSTGNAYQDATTTATYRFDAEQTANNS